MKTVDQGIFLHRSPYSDSSLITTFYTRKNGLQKFLFKGGKKKAHNIYPLALSELTYYGRNNELLNLTSVEGLYPHSFQFDPVRSTVAFFIAEVIRKCVHSGDVDDKMFVFFESSIQRLNSATDVRLFPLQFLIDCSDVLGFLPYQEEQEGTYFNIDAGVFQKTDSRTERVFTGNSVSLILDMLNNDFLDKNWTKETRTDALALMLNYYSIHIPGFAKLESFEIIKEVLNA